jgi:DNA repair protein RadC
VIAAAIELGKRKITDTALDLLTIRNGRDAADFIRNTLHGKNYEVFAAIYLNAAGKSIKFCILSQGGLTSTVADPRIIIKKALEENAIRIILCHNHPSGRLHPSQPDIEITQKVKEGAKLLDMVLLDHIIVNERAYFSFADEGLL